MSCIKQLLIINNDPNTRIKLLNTVLCILKHLKDPQIRKKILAAFADNFKILEIIKSYLKYVVELKYSVKKRALESLDYNEQIEHDYSINLPMARLPQPFLNKITLESSDQRSIINTFSILYMSKEGNLDSEEDSWCLPIIELLINFIQNNQNEGQKCVFESLKDEEGGNVLQNIMFIYFNTTDEGLRLAIQWLLKILIVPSPDSDFPRMVSKFIFENWVCFHFKYYLLLFKTWVNSRGMPKYTLK